MLARIRTVNVCARLWCVCVAILLLFSFELQFSSEQKKRCQTNKQTSTVIQQCMRGFVSVVRTRLLGILCHYYLSHTHSCRHNFLLLSNFKCVYDTGSLTMLVFFFSPFLVACLPLFANFSVKRPNRFLSSTIWVSFMRTLCTHNHF